MRQTARLLKTLKHYLKTRHITYSQLADEMGLSETSVKRLFSQKTFSLQRLETVCDVLGIELFDLVLLDKKMNRDAECLTLEQERDLADNPKMFTFFYFLLNGWPLSQIINEYEITEQEATQMMLEMDRIGLIELHANNAYRVLLSKNVYWRKFGPMWNIYGKKIIDEFLDSPSSFESPNSYINFVPGQLSETSVTIVRKKMDELIRQINDLAEADTLLPIGERYSTGLIMAFRPWIFSMIAGLKKKRVSEHD